jgi:anti-sigma factor RsiW
MSCVDWEERIALYAGGDLAAAEAQAVERHVAECGGCQLLLSGLRESLGLLREAHGEPVEAAHFAAVRARVLAELERGPARGWRWAWVYAMAAAAAMALLVAMRPRTEQRLALPLPHAPAAPAVARVVAKAPQAHRQVAERSETVLMKIETDNPDVVIYWIAEKGETK